MFGDLRDFVLAANFDLQGVAATVTVPDGDPVETSVIWLTTETVDSPFGGELTRRDPRRMVAIRRDEVPAVPMNTVMVAPEKPGGEPEEWLVSGYGDLRADQHRVIVVPNS